MHMTSLEVTEDNFTCKIQVLSFIRYCCKVRKTFLFQSVRICSSLYPISVSYQTLIYPISNSELRLKNILSVQLTGFFYWSALGPISCDWTICYVTRGDHVPHCLSFSL